MRLTKEHAEANRQRIVAEAGQLFRERGFDGISVAELMQAAGFTHGGFYNHFASKADLMADVTRDMLARATANLLRITDPNKGGKEDLFAAYVDIYLSPAARDDPGRACPISTLSQDVLRQEGDVKSAFAQGLEAYLEAFAKALPDVVEDHASRRARAITAFAALIGGLAMARAVASENEAFSQEILDCVGAAVKSPSCRGDTGRR
jgi:TetR/AcrR family transcriptional regulator, transcriptional repressor for nem operon